LFSLAVSLNLHLNSANNPINLFQQIVTLRLAIRTKETSLVIVSLERFVSYPNRS
jgi:hypothetical protein